MNVYLAGKIDRQYGAWRDAILGTGYLRKNPVWVREIETARAEEGEVLPWLPVPLGVFGVHDYVGPFRQEVKPSAEIECLGTWHGTTSWGNHGFMDPGPEGPYPEIIRNARRAIQSADLIFAFINYPDAYGTVAEIGYAAALGKFVTVLVGKDAPFAQDDYWFVEGLATVSLDWWRYRDDYASEGQLAAAALKDAFVAHAAWKEQVSRHPVPLVQNAMPEETILRAVAQSFSQIERWTSDPRVRSEAETMLRALGRRG
jgi:nucleoside 2-deoxyribosyltransferase